MTKSLLLDTCACIWIAEGSPISPASRAAIEEALASDVGLYVSAITAWEMATLVRKRRYELIGTPQAWFDALMGLPGVRLLPLTPELLIESVLLPGEPPNDPADRMIAASARMHGLTVVTRDKPIREYAAAGWVNVIAC